MNEKELFKAVKKMGRRILIDEDEFILWIENQSNRDFLSGGGKREYLKFALQGRKGLF